MGKTALVVVAIAVGCGGSQPAPAEPACASEDRALLVEARMFLGQGYLHRARARARAALGRCHNAEARALAERIEAALSPAGRSATALVSDARRHRRRGHPTRARRAAARALIAAEEHGPLRPVARPPLARPEAVAFTETGDALLVAYADTGVLRFDLEDGAAPPRRASAPDLRARTAAIQGRHGVRVEGAAIVVEADPPRRLVGHRAPVRAVAIDPDGLLVASAADDGVRLWDLTLAAPMAHLVVDPERRWLVMAADGRVDGSDALDGGPSYLAWRAGDLVVPGFVGWQRFHHPGLLADLAGRRTPF